MQEQPMRGARKTYWRRIVATSAVYAAAGWAAVEALTTVIDRFGLPAWMGTLITAAFVAGLPVTVLLVWRTAGEEHRLDIPTLVGAITLLVVGTAAIFGVTRPSPVAPANLVAIVPCQFNGHSDLAYRAEGLAEDVHARLSRVDAVKISSWNSSLFVRDKGYDPQQIAELLNVDRLVQCRVRSGPDRIELSAELLDPQANRILWNRDYNFVAADLGTVVTELASTLLDVLGTPAEAAEMERVNDLGTFSPEAYDLYLQARLAGDLGTSGDLIAQALQIDPNFPDALVFSAGLFLQRAVAEDFETMEEPRAWLYETRSLSQRALELDRGVLSARLNLAAVCELLGTYYEEHCPEGEQERLRWEECEVRGDTAEGWACWHRVLARRGDDNTEALERWLELEPTNVMANMQYMGLRASQAADFADILAVFETLRALAPEDRRPFGLISNVLRERGRLDEVLAWRYGVSQDELPDNPWVLARLATDYMNLGLDEQASEPGVRTFETRPASSVHFMPILWKRLGEPEKAVELLEWNAETVGANAPGVFLFIANIYAGQLGRYDLSKQHYDRALSDRNLPTLCEHSENCVAWSALLLAHTERALGNEGAAAEWLETAESAIGRVDETKVPSTPTTSSSMLRAVLQIGKGRFAEAVALLRDIVFSWETDMPGGYLSAPIYLLETGSLFEPLREAKAFRQLLEDYKAHLEPMRERVLKAQSDSDWEGLRRRTYQSAYASDGQSDIKSAHESSRDPTPRPDTGG